MRADLLKTLATNFGSNSAVAAKAIREIYLLDPVGFPPAVEELLRDQPDLPGAPYMMALLVSEADWLQTVCNPEKYTLQQSLHLIRRARKLDPCTEVKLAKMLASFNFTSAADTRFASRVLDVLEQSPDPSTALPALRHLSQNSNGHVRSKAALLIGRISRNPQWANQGPAELDPRVSANAIESLWGMDAPAAREAFYRAARDQYHRIAANGIVGLHLMGDPSSIPFLFNLGRSEKNLEKAAAAWAMGHVKDPRFLPSLARLMEDPDPMVSACAFRSIGAVRKKMSQLRASGLLHVQIRDCECRGQNHQVRFVVTKDEALVTGLDMHQFVVWSGPEVVEEFLSSLQQKATTYYQIEYQGPPSPTNLVKIQVYAPQGVGEDTAFEMVF